MKIIKYHALDSSFPINAIAISPNEQFIAIGDSNKQITIYNYQSLLIFYRAKPSENYPPTKLSNDINCYILSTISIPKLVLDFHTEQISALTFSNTQANILFSAGYDKFIAVWKISPNNFSAEKLKVTQLKAEITDMVLYPDDSYLLVSCFDNCVYILRCNFSHGFLDVVATMEAHDNVVNAIAIDPLIVQNGRFASLSDKGRLIIACFNKMDNSIIITNNYEEFINPKHKCNIIQKKIDWSIDGKWIISVDHHQIKKQNILHARLINMDNPNTSQALIGHDSPVLIARFSKCLYSEKSEVDQFQLCATTDKNGNLIIWKVENENFRVLVEINNYSESNITNMVWGPNGEYLFTVSSSGSVCTVELNEFNIKSTSKKTSEKEENELNSWNMLNDPNQKVKKKIVPTLISGPKSMIDDEIAQRDYSMNQEEQRVECQGCLRCRKQLYQVIENVNEEAPVEGLLTKDHNKAILCWENHTFDNCSIIKMKIGSSFLFANKYLNRMIKLFTNSNFFYGFYDTNFTLNVYSLLNTPLITKMYFEEISILESYQNYVLLLTSQNRLIVINVINNEKITDEILNICSTPYNAFQTKIDSVFFISLDKIIIKADAFNPYKNTSNKMVFYFEQKTNNLRMASEDLSSEEKKIIANVNTERTKYHNYFENHILAEGRKVSEIDCYKISSEVELCYDAIYKCRYLGNDEGLMNSIKTMFKIVQKQKENFRYIIDDFVETYNKMSQNEQIIQLYKDFNNAYIEDETSKLEQINGTPHAQKNEETYNENKNKLNEDIQENIHSTLKSYTQMIPEGDVEMKQEETNENGHFIHDHLSNPREQKTSENLVSGNEIKEEAHQYQHSSEQPQPQLSEHIQSYSSEVPHPTEQIQLHPIEQAHQAETINNHRENEAQSKEDQMEVEESNGQLQNESAIDKNNDHPQKVTQGIEQSISNTQSLVSPGSVSKKVDENKTEEIIKGNEENKEQMQVESVNPLDKPENHNKAPDNPNLTN